MHLRTQQNQRSRFAGNDVGKSICISFGSHELDLIDALDKLALSECVNRSQWIRRRIREENRKLKEQEELWDHQKTSWNTLVGQK